MFFERMLRGVSKFAIFSVYVKRPASKGGETKGGIFFETLTVDSHDGRRSSSDGAASRCSRHGTD
jgi:hypothetical protein